MTDENISPQETTFGQRMRIAAGAFLRALFRLVVIAVILGILAVGVFYGARQLNNYYQSTQQSIQHLQDSQTSQQDSIRQMAENLDILKERINTIEIQNDTQKEAISELAGKFSELEREQQDYLEELEDGRSQDQSKLDEFDSRLEQLGNELDSLSSQVEQSGDQLENLEEQLTTVEDEIAAVEEVLETGDVSVAVLRRELQMLKAMELLTRSRLFLVENNLGLAEDDIQTARDLLAALVVPDYQQATLDEIISRLDSALENLPESPVLAAEDLEIAWQLLKAGLPEEASAETATEVTMAPEVTATAQIPESTPTPTPNP